MHVFSHLVSTQDFHANFATIMTEQTVLRCILGLKDEPLVDFDSEGVHYYTISPCPHGDAFCSFKYVLDLSDSKEAALTYVMVEYTGTDLLIDPFSFE